MHLYQVSPRPLVGIALRYDAWLPETPMAVAMIVVVAVAVAAIAIVAMAVIVVN
jgi:hypothetical protein